MFGDTPPLALQLGVGCIDFSIIDEVLAMFWGFPCLQDFNSN